MLAVARNGQAGGVSHGWQVPMTQLLAFRQIQELDAILHVESGETLTVKAHDACGDIARMALERLAYRPFRDIGNRDFAPSAGDDDRRSCLGASRSGEDR